MALFTSLALVGGALVAGVAARRKTQPPALVDALIDGKPKQAVLLPAPAQKLVAQAQGLAQDLFGDTRQEYQRALNTTYTGEEEQRAELEQRLNLMVATTGLGLAVAGALIAPIFYLPSALCALYGTKPLAEMSYHALVHERRIDYRLLWAITVPIALLGGFILEASFGAVFGILNLYLVSRTERRSKQRVADLFGGQVHTVWLLIDGVEVEVPFEQIGVGDTVVVHAGQMIPVDGTITHGAATVDQHTLTGESQPVEKAEGESVLASTVVLSGRIHIHVDQAGDASIAAQITEMLSQTTDFKQSLRSRTDRFLNWMLLPVLAGTVLALPLAGVTGAVAVLWYYPGARMMFFGPMSMLSYLQIAAQRRILIKDGRALEALKEVDTVVFDKTGTLTLDQPTVSRIITYNGLTEPDLLRYTAAAEVKQSHPIAQAILRAATDSGLELPELDDAHYKVGYGIKVQIEGRTVRVGSMRFMQSEGISVSPAVAEQQTQSHDLGNSLVLAAVDDEVAGAIELAPTIRPEAQQIVEYLHERGIETAIISGDNDAPTQRLAATLGIDRYFAEVLPEDKANHIAELQAEGHKVCFVGDGINDSIALKTADVAVSLQGATTIATDMAEIIFMDGTLEQVPTLFTLVDDFAANMRTNLVAATLPGVVGIAGTLLFGWGMGIAVLLSQGSTPVGIYNAIKPLLDERQEKDKELNPNPLVV